MYIFPTASYLVLLLAPQILCIDKEWLLSNYLWTETEHERYEALSSYFINGISNANLDPDHYGLYNVEDAVYFYYVKESLDIAAKKTTDPTLKDFLEARSESYQKYYTAAIETWHISDQEGIVLGSDPQNYVNHLKHVAETMDGHYLVVALTPCARLWPWLGEQIDASTGEFGVYTKWIKSNLDPEYKGYEKYEKLINDAYTQQQITEKDALSVYKTSMASEAAFFNSVKPSGSKGHHDEF